MCTCVVAYVGRIVYC